MELALGAMAGLAPKLGDLLMAEYVVQKGLKPDIVSLSDELVMMNAALVDASQIPPDQLNEVKNRAVKNYLGDVAAPYAREITINDV